MTEVTDGARKDGWIAWLAKEKLCEKWPNFDEKHFTWMWSNGTSEAESCKAKSTKVVTVAIPLKAEKT